MIGLRFCPVIVSAERTNAPTRCCSYNQAGAQSAYLSAASRASSPTHVDRGFCFRLHSLRGCLSG